MFKDYAKEIISIMQTIHNDQKGRMDFAIKGEMATLLYISNNEVVIPTEISDSLKITTARVTSCLNSLANKGLITREINEDDRRQILIKITEAGLKQASVIREKHLNFSTEVFRRLGEEDTLKSIELLKKIKDILNEIDIKELEGDKDVTTKKFK